MEYYIEAFRRYFEFHGRSSRSEYWYFALFNIMIMIALGVMSSIIEEYFNLHSFFLINSVYFLAILIPSLAVAVRRMHDIGKSGWWLLVYFIPLVGGISLLVLLVIDSEYGRNKYGENPKGIGNYIDEFDEINRHLVD